MFTSFREVPCSSVKAQSSQVFQGLVWQQPFETGSGYTCHYRTWSLLCCFLFWGPWPRSKLICGHLPRQCAPCVQSQRALKQTREGPGEQVPALSCPPMASCHTSTCRDRDTSTEQGRRCACQLRWGPQAGPWPLTVSEKGDQVSLAMTVKLKGHASECWGWLLCDLLGTSPYE